MPLFFLLAESVVPGKGNALTRQKGRRNQVKGVEELAQSCWRASHSGRIGGGTITGNLEKRRKDRV